MNDICITKVGGFRGITMESFVRRYIVSKGQEKPLLDACIIFPSQIDAAVAKAMVGTGKFEVWVKGIVLTRVVMLLNSELPVIAYVTRMKIPWKKSSEWLIQ